MKLLTILFSTLLLVLSGGVAQAQASFADGVDLTTIKAPWKLRILGNDLDITKVQAKPDRQSAYFMMTSESTNLNVSVFIEPVDKCRSGEACRDQVLAAGNPGWGEYRDLAKGKIKDFSYFEFYRPEVKGQPLKILDMYAEYVSDGFWIDVHISKVLYKKEDHTLFEKVINSTTFVPKGVERKDAFDGEFASAGAAARTWLAVWGTLKCRESYLGLSAITRSENTEKSWIDYCNTVNNTLGANRSREVIAAAFTRSLPPKTDQPVGILAFQSDFTKTDRSVVEIVGLLLEKNGTWSVTNYLPQ